MNTDPSRANLADLVRPFREPGALPPHFPESVALIATVGPKELKAVTSNASDIYYSAMLNANPALDEAYTPADVENTSAAEQTDLSSEIPDSTIARITMEAAADDEALASEVKRDIQVLSRKGRVAVAFAGAALIGGVIAGSALAVDAIQEGKVSGNQQAAQEYEQLRADLIVPTGITAWIGAVVGGLLGNALGDRYGGQLARREARRRLAEAQQRAESSKRDQQ